MPDTTTGDLATQGGSKPIAVGNLKMLPTDGIVVVDPHAKWIASGRKKILIKSRPFKISGIDFLLITRNKALGIIKLSAPKLIDLKEFKELEPLHLIDDLTRKKFWPGYREFWAYKVLSMKVFAEPIAIKPLVGPQVVAHDVELQVEKSPSIFDLEKAAGQAIPNFGAWLDVLSERAPKWVKSTLRFVEGPADLVSAVKSFMRALSEFKSIFGGGGGEADKNANFPTALEQAARWGKRALKALEDSKQDNLVKAAKTAIDLLEKIQSVVDNLERAEDNPKLNVG